MNQDTRHTMAHPRLDHAQLYPSLTQGGRRVLATTAFGKAAKERTSSDLLGFARPFVPSSPRRPDTRLRSERIGASTSPATGWTSQTTHFLPDLVNQVPFLCVKQESDFPWEITIGLFDAQKILALCASGARRGKPICRRSRDYLTPLTNMPRRKTPGTVPFALDISSEARSRFMALHEAFGSKTKAATLESLIFAVSLKDKIDPQILQQIAAKLDRVLEHLEDTA